MAKKVGQIRWFKDNNEKNYPANISADALSSGSAFPRSYSIVQFGIQTLPGTKIFLDSHPDPIIIGATGIYELSVDGLTKINSITFDNASLELIENNDNAYVLIDYIYEE